jgi:hypothetical protein
MSKAITRQSEDFSSSLHVAFFHMAFLFLPLLFTLTLGALVSYDGPDTTWNETVLLLMFESLFVFLSLADHHP